MLLTELAAYLQAQGIGTQGVSLFYGTMPETDPTDSSPVTVVLYEYGGTMNEPDLGTGNTRLEFPSVQIVCRGLANDYNSPRQKATDIVTALTKVINQTLSGVSYKAIEPKQALAAAQPDAFTPNLAMSLNPLVYYRFGEATTAGGTLDASPHGLNGVYNQSTITLGEPGVTNDNNTAVEIGGTSSVIRADNALFHGMTSMTAILFVKASTPPPSVPAPNKLLSDADGAIFYLSPNPFSPPDTLFNFDAHNGAGALTGQFSWVNNVWQMLIGVYDATDISVPQKVYVNGQILNAAAGGAMSFGTNGFLIGDPNADSIHDAPWVRQFDEFMLFNYALTPAQVSALYASLTQR